MIIIYNGLILSTTRNPKLLEELANAMASAFMQSYPQGKI